jgi:hypothetical protein
MTAKGYGEYKPVNSCWDDVYCSEEQHQLNRRTFYDNDFRVHQIRNQDFIVPWQLVENNKTEVVVK